jgi:hypothetical protein
MQVFSADSTIFKKNKTFSGYENIKKPTSKVAYSRPQFFFSVLPTGPKPAQISISVP